MKLILAGGTSSLIRDGMKELDEQNQKVLTLLILQRFYQTPFQAKEDEEFYREFFERLSSVNEILGF